LAEEKSYSVLAAVASKMLAEPGAALNIGPTGTAWEKKPLRPLFTNVVEGVFSEVT
jgi:hypothetical protein